MQEVCRKSVMRKNVARERTVDDRYVVDRSVDSVRNEQKHESAFGAERSMKKGEDTE